MWVDKTFIYQVNTWVWLNTLSRRYGHAITLANVPDEAVDDLARPNIDVIWLMGIWQRSPAGRKNALKYKHEYVGALPDLTDNDVIGSAYSIYGYSVDERIGGRAGLAALRHRLRERGLLLMLDYVPNHVGIDHPWLESHPDYLIQGTPDDARKRPSDFFNYKNQRGKQITFAHGRDPLFPGWEDTVQLNVFNPDLRAAVIDTLIDIADQCDGVRCDMAMLVMNDIFAGTWQPYLKHYPRPAVDYWLDIIPGVRAQYPNFYFIAEVYWNKEWDVLQQGFDYAYDKTLYDRIMEGSPTKIRQHLLADIHYQQRMLRFVENHDEPRAFERLGYERSFPAATLITTTPGATLLHQGQMTGRTVKLPVQISRQPDEPAYYDLHHYYINLLRETLHPIYQTGEWYLFSAHPTGSDHSHNNLLVYGWRLRGREYRLVVVNVTAAHSKAFVPLSFWSEIRASTWALYDVINGQHYLRQGAEMLSPGLYIELKPFESHIFRFERVSQPIAEAPVEQTAVEIISTAKKA